MLFGEPFPISYHHEQVLVFVCKDNLAAFISVPKKREVVAVACEDIWGSHLASQKAEAQHFSSRKVYLDARELQVTDIKGLAGVLSEELYILQGGFFPLGFRVVSIFFSLFCFLFRVEETFQASCYHTWHSLLDVKEREWELVSNSICNMSDVWRTDLLKCSHL